MSCREHGGPSKWRVMFKIAPGMFASVDCWAATRKTAIRVTRAATQERWPSIRLRLEDVQELRRRG